MEELERGRHGGVEMVAISEMRIIDSAEFCLDDSHRLREDTWRGEVIHRIKVPGPHQDASAIARFDRNYPSLGRMAYHLVIHPNGLVEQALPFDRISPHCRGYNGSHIAIGCVGDFRTYPMAAPQWLRLREILIWCSLFRGGVVDFFGHTEKKGTSDDPNKECPGRLVNLEGLRESVRLEVAHVKACPPNPGFRLASA
jgi:hypothetical protein